MGRVGGRCRVKVELQIIYIFENLRGMRCEMLCDGEGWGMGTGVVWCNINGLAEAKIAVLNIRGGMEAITSLACRRGGFVFYWMDEGEIEGFVGTKIAVLLLSISLFYARYLTLFADAKIAVRLRCSQFPAEETFPKRE